MARLYKRVPFANLYRLYKYIDIYIYIYFMERNNLERSLRSNKNNDSSMKQTQILQDCLEEFCYIIRWLDRF